MNNLILFFNLILNWMVFYRYSMFKWIIKIYRPGLPATGKRSGSVDNVRSPSFLRETWNRTQRVSTLTSHFSPHSTAISVKSLSKWKEIWQGTKRNNTVMVKCSLAPPVAKNLRENQIRCDTPIPARKWQNEEKQSCSVIWKSWRWKI